MFSKQKLLKRILSLILAFLLGFNSLAVPLTLAEGEEGGEIVLTAEVTNPPTESTITTGDAESQAETTTIANVNVDCVEGQVSTPEDPCTPPTVEVGSDCPSEVEIINDNSATVSAEATSSATSGENQITGSSGDALVNSGDATAGAQLEDFVNANLTNLTNALNSSDSSDSAEECVGESPLVVQNTNEGDLANQATVSAQTGDNQVSDNSSDATIVTGNALAYANLLNFLNSNVVGSDFKLYLLNELNGFQGAVDLNQAWQELVANGEFETFGLGLGGSSGFLIQNQNEGNLTNQVQVSASSGSNEASGNSGEASILTGEATALANVINFVNFNLVGGQFFLGVVNVFGNYLGDLILPRPEGFANSLVVRDEEMEIAGLPSAEQMIFENQNLAELNDSVSATAESGSNQTDNNLGDSLIQTGDATARANSFSLINTNISLNNWFFLMINHLGSWTGKILGWAAPGTTEAGVEGEPTVFQLGAEGEDGEETAESQGLPEGEGPVGIIQNQNQAQVSNQINVCAQTGQNNANENLGGAQVKTGRATALANLFNLANLNIFGSRWFLGVVNVLGDWVGNVIFAYPDVTVGLSNGSGQAQTGEVTHYTLSFQNQGYDEADEVSLRLQLPEGIGYLSDNSGQTPVVDGQTCIWNLGQLEPGEAGSFRVEVRVDPDFSFGEPQLTFWERIIPQAQAAGEELSQAIVAEALIGTTDPESDTANNTASVTTVVYSPLENDNRVPPEPTVDQRQPVLEITAKNNVSEFVYPGDTITFEITIVNQSETPAYNVYLKQALYNGVPADFGIAEFSIGDLQPHEGGKLTFGLKLNGGQVLPAGHYRTVAQAFGEAANGNQVTSNEAKTYFDLKWRELSSLLEAKAEEEKEGTILGAVQDVCQDKEELLPYVLLFLLSSLWLIERTKKTFKIKPCLER